MTNIEKQADEILASQSIFDRKFRLLDENQYELLIEFDLPSSFTIQFNDEKLQELGVYSVGARSKFLRTFELVRSADK